MECERHPGQEADLTCMKCGKHFCRECVKETRESHYCPDCHQAEVERFASKLAPREAKPKKEKEPREPRKPKKKTLKKPAEKPVAGEDALEPTVKQAPPEPEPPSTMSEEEKAEFWGDIEQPRRSEKSLAAGPPLEPEPATKPSPPKAPEAPQKARTREPIRVEGLPPLPEELEGEQQESGKEEPTLVPETRKRRIQPKSVRREAVLAAEGFPERPSGEAREEAVAGEGRRAKRRAPRRPPVEVPVAMQVPQEYDGEVTPDPVYWKAVLFAFIAGIVGAAVYAGLAWWLHWDRGIFGWLIGLMVGVAVVFGSGRHFNWKLGLISAAIAMFFVSMGRIAYFMLDVRFNDILPLKIGFFDLFEKSLRFYFEQFFTLWLLFFIIAGVVAFLVSFRPWPIRLEATGLPGRAARRHA